MTQQQIRYARARVEALRDQKVKRLREEQEKRWDAARNILEEEIAAGRFTVRPKAELRKLTSRADLLDVVVFTRYPDGLEEVKKAVDAANAALDERVALVKKHATEIIDGLVLGDAEAAIAKIGAFEKAKF